MKRLLFFINPNAGHAEIRGTLMEVLEIFSAGGYEVTVHMTTGPRDLTRQIAARGAQYDLIVCTGGDGTLNEAVSGLMALPYEKRPKLGYIPGGTVNDVASTLGLSKDTVRAAQEIMDGHPFPLDIGSFGPDRFFTYVAAFGIFTDVPYETPQEDKRIWGRLAYIMNGAGALGRLKPTHVRVFYDDHQEEADVLVGLVTSTTSVGGFKTTRDLGISLNDGLYEMILVRATKKSGGVQSGRDPRAAAGLRQRFVHLRTDGRAAVRIRRAGRLDRRRRIRRQRHGSGDPQRAPRHRYHRALKGREADHAHPICGPRRRRGLSCRLRAVYRYVHHL